MAIACPYCAHRLHLKAVKPGRYRPKCPNCAQPFLLSVPEEAGAAYRVEVLPTEPLRAPTEPLRAPTPEREKSVTPVVPVLGILLCLLLMLSLPSHNWYRLFGWMFIGLIVYLVYGYRSSVLRRRTTGRV